MRTLHDLESAFADLADTAPDADVLSVPSAERAPVRRYRRMLAPAAAVVATVAVVGGIVYATSGPDTKQPPTAGVPHSLQALHAPRGDESIDGTFRFTADAPAGSSTVAFRGIDRGGQELQFRKPPTAKACPATPDGIDCRQVAGVRLNYVDPASDPDEANFDITKFKDRDPVQVDGKRGFYSGGTANMSDKSVKLYWEYATAAWAVAVAPTRAAELTLAESVRPARISVDVPVSAKRGNDKEYVNVLQSESSRDGGYYEVATPGARDGGFIVTWGERIAQEQVDPADPADLHDVVINGRTWTIRDDDQPSAILTNSGVPVEVTPNYGRGDELEKIIERLRIADDLSDRGSWFDAADLLR